MSLANPPVYDGDSEPFILELIDWFTASAGDRYSESVSQLEHALQCAYLAEDESASQTEIVAALLHDVGHILMLKQRLEGKGDSRDLRHEHVGATWLERVFPKSVSEPIRLHVPAAISRYRSGLLGHSLLGQSGACSCRAVRWTMKRSPHSNN